MVIRHADPPGGRCVREPTAGACPGVGSNLDLAAEPVSVPAPRVVPAIALVVAALLLVAVAISMRHR